MNFKLNPCTKHMKTHMYQAYIIHTSKDFFFPGSRAPLRINVLHVPSPAVSGSSAVLRCGFELGSETLYALKWYKDAAEFYRYVPASDTPFKTFPQPGVHVDVSHLFNTFLYRIFIF